MKDVSSKFTICVVGRSGSGKGTQAEILLSILGKRAHHMETGRFFRELIQKYSNPTTRIARTLMEHGKLFPWWFPVFAWLREMIVEGAADKHFIFDGAPRRLEEVKLLDEVLTWHKRPKALCIYLDVSEHTVTERLRARGRRDDADRAIKNRMRYFTRDVMPVIRYFEKRKRLIRVDGERDPAVVSKDIIRILSRRLGSTWRTRS